MIMLVCVCNIDIYGGLKCKKVNNKEKHPEENSPDLFPEIHMVSGLSSMAIVVLVASSA